VGSTRLWTLGKGVSGECGSQFSSRARRGPRRTIGRAGAGRGRRGGGDLPAFESASEPWPVSILPAGSGFVVVRGGRTQGDEDRSMVRPHRGE